MYNCVFAIKADFLTGIYIGGGRSGQSTESFPSFARLYSALVAASYGISGADNGELPGTIKNALEWLEEHRPMGLYMPDCTPLDSKGLITYMNKGILSGNCFKVVGSSMGEGTLFHEPLVWLWDIYPPNDISEIISDICCEVSYLGRSESLAEISVMQDKDIMNSGLVPSHISVCGFPKKENLEVRCPVPGRLIELDEAQSSRIKKSVKESFNKKKKEEIISMVVSENKTYPFFFEKVNVVNDNFLFPWSDGIFWESRFEVPRSQFISSCVSLHRGLCSMLGEQYAPALTGRRDESSRALTNRVSLQYIDPETAKYTVYGKPGFLMAFPSDIDSQERKIIRNAANKLNWVGISKYEKADLANPVSIDLCHFWKPLKSNKERAWVTRESMVPEMSLYRGRAKKEVPMRTIIKKSLFNVFKNTIEINQDNFNEYFEKMDLELHVDLYRGNYKQFYKIKKGSTVVPLKVFLKSEKILNNEAFLALGQSRHIGGGLLQPIDLDTE